MIPLLCVLLYVLMIPGMYCVACAVDKVLAVEDGELENGWGIAVVWPLLIIFLLLALVAVMIAAPFGAATHGRKCLRDAIMMED